MLRTLTSKYKTALIFFFLALVLILVTVAFRPEEPTEGPELVPPVVRREEQQQKNVWEGLLPGESNLISDVPTDTQLLAQEVHNDLYTTSFYSFGDYSTSVEIYSRTDTSRIDYVIVPAIIEGFGFVDEEVASEGLGSPDLELYANEFSQKVLVFLEEGVAYKFNEQSGGISERIYFAPTTAEDFLNFFEGRFSLEPFSEGH